MLIIFLVLSGSVLCKDPELWRDVRYLKRFVEPKYIPVSLYRDASIKMLENKHPGYVRNVVIQSMKTFAWHNIKIIVKQDINLNVSETSPLMADSLNNKFMKLLSDHKITKGYHILFSYVEQTLPLQTVGYTTSNSGCNPAFATTVVQIEKSDHKIYGYEHLTLSHELGHAFLVKHVENLSSNCIAYDGLCAMTPLVSHWALTLPYPPAFSIQGFIQLRKFFNSYYKNEFLLENINITQYQQCGNGMVDPGEECDCGFEANCIITGEYECCDMKTCKLKQNAECSHGACCDNCRFLTGTICRSEASECDIAENCDGTSAFCPIDKKHSDGTSCRNAQAYCVNGKCADANKQCQQLFPYIPSMYSPEKCVLNSLTLSKYELIEPAKMDTRQTSSCGLLVCFTVGEVVSAFFKRDLFNGNCSIVEPPKSDNSLGYIPNGHKCGEEMMCLNNLCIDAMEHSEKCKNINCVEGTVCKEGVCVGEYVEFSRCRDVICPSNQYCNLYGRCAEYKIPEYVENKKIYQQPLYKRYKSTPDRYKHKLGPSIGQFPWKSKNTTFIHPMFEPNFETPEEIKKKYTYIAMGYGSFFPFLLISFVFYILILRL